MKKEIQIMSIRTSQDECCFSFQSSNFSSVHIQIVDEEGPLISVAALV